MIDNKKFIDIISNNINKFGWHIYVVQQDVCPRYLYTIGLSKEVGFEIVLAGAILYDFDQSLKIVNYISNELFTHKISKDSLINIDGLGHFTLRECHNSWTKRMLIGAIDYYKKDSLTSVQILPSIENVTIDVPDLSRDWSPLSQPVWCCFEESWELPIPSYSTATTNLRALRGEKVTEASRWEEDEWELFAGSGPDTREEDMRVVPLASLIAVDTSLQAVVSLKIGESIWREDGESEWHVWKSS